MSKHFIFKYISIKQKNQHFATLNAASSIVLKKQNQNYFLKFLRRIKWNKKKAINEHADLIIFILGMRTDNALSSEKYNQK